MEKKIYSDLYFAEVPNGIVDIQAGTELKIYRYSMESIPPEGSFVELPLDGTARYYEVLAELKIQDNTGKQGLEDIVLRVIKKVTQY